MSASAGTTGSLRKTGWKITGSRMKGKKLEEDSLFVRLRLLRPRIDFVGTDRVRGDFAVKHPRTDEAPGYHSTRRAGRQTVKTMLRAAGLLALLLMAAGTARALDNSDCFACHSDKELTKTNKAGKVVSLFVDEKEYGASIHGKNLCTSCHADITEVPHPDGYTHKPVACSACHRVETEIYLKSDHGQAVAKGESEAASCKDCHGHSHTLLNYRNPLSPVNHANIPQTCGRCHGNTAEMEKFNLYQRAPVVTYDRSVHGVALEKRGVTQAAVCTDCHGSHDLHKSTNPASKLYWQNIPGTCGKCHDNVKNTYQRSVHGKAVARWHSGRPGLHGLSRRTHDSGSQRSQFQSFWCAYSGDVRAVSRLGTHRGPVPVVVEGRGDVHAEFSWSGAAVWRIDGGQLRVVPRIS